MGLFKKNKKDSRKHSVTDAPLTLKPEHMVPTPPKHMVPCDERALEQIGNQLQKRLKKELNGILGEVVDTAIDNTRAEMEQMLRNELIGMLESRLDQLVETAIKKHLTLNPKNSEDE